MTTNLPATVPFDGAVVQVTTMVYACVDGKILTLERGAHKTFLPGWFMGVGGKAEAGERIEAAAAREFAEETGMRATGMALRGTYTFVSEMLNNWCGVIYIYVADGVEGEFTAEVADGTLRWLTMAELLASEKVMPDHKVWLKEIFTTDNHFACVGSWDGVQRSVEWADSRGYFRKREAA